ncbi:hypothetical protein Taro_032302 [Colocasia esculenta]|uniref:NAD-dependent epimerase/dehydratase domain-containing protein n=1 Tax=Colocasia esculenta TaxID=4460 RepID=A0A843W1J2_COLES|nr:hypothetical protein [Colocasia esculenta]
MVWSRGDSGRLVGPAVVLLIKFKKKYLSFHRGRHRLAATPVEGSKRTRRWTQEKVKLPEADGEVDAPAPLFTGKRLEQLGLATCWPPPCPALPCLKSRRCNASSRCLLDRLATCFVLLLIIIKGVANPPSRLVLLCRPHPSGALVRVPPPASSPSPSLPRGWGEVVMDRSSPDMKKGMVCVTGASGYLASWLVKRLLLSGYHVRGTVREPENFEKVEHLWRLEGAEERLQLVKADLMEEGSFDDAVMGCEGVFHTASPVVSVKSDPKAWKPYLPFLPLSKIFFFGAEILDPSIKGTINVLGSCKKNPSLRRVVLTSSSSTVRVREDIDPKVSLDETSWSSVELCERLQVN